MAKRTANREKRISAARRRAERRSSGFETTTIRLPEGVSKWKLKAGVHNVDFIPYKVGKGNDQSGGNPEAETGEYPYYERTYWVYKDVGAEEKWYICSSKTFAKRDFIQEWKKKEASNPDANTKLIESLKPSERQIFLVWEHADKDTGIQLFDHSNFMFGKLLDSRITFSPEETGWDFFYLPDKKGFTLRITAEDLPPYGIKATAIDFMPRSESLPKSIVEHGICLDDLLIETSYEKLRDIFLNVVSDEFSGEENIKEKEKKEKEELPQVTMSESKPKPKIKTAEDCGLEKSNMVMYKDKAYEVFRISGGGTSLTLMDESDSIVKGIGVDEVELITNKDLPDDDDEFEENVLDTDDTGDTEWDEGEEWDE